MHDATIKMIYSMFKNQWYDFVNIILIFVLVNAVMNLWVL